MHGWGVTRGMSHASHLSRSRLPLMHSYASLASEASPLPPFERPLSTPASRSLPLQILLALFTTLVVLSSVLQVTGLHTGLQYADGHRGFGVAPAPVALSAADAPHDPLDSEIFQAILKRLDADAESGVSFSIAYNGRRVRNGDFVPMDEAASAPSITVADGSALFTWVLVDVDAPDPADPSHAPFLHYIVADLRAAAGSEPPPQAAAGRVLVPYYPVTPPVGAHRYVSLLFRQHEGDSAEPPRKRLGEQRANFDVAAFAEDRALVLVQSAHFYSKPAETRRLR
ncbi:hypothetical protein PybrP1_000251 [[Pythium] brassicae (nom. inval.)]|nr:hypothetical protein PybrP1_000251 [[Pythium] brassicae (nom. inval.)]